jgi:hypothetical protein
MRFMAAGIASARHEKFTKIHNRAAGNKKERL